MRTILFTMLVVVGIGLAGTSGASAAPVNGAVINEAVRITDPVEQVRCGWGARPCGVCERNPWDYRPLPDYCRRQTYSKNRALPRQ
jgi:hypothetical protein